MSPDARDLVLVVVSVLAGVQYVINSYSLVRNRNLENINRFLSVHQRLFEPDGYIMLNVEKWEAGKVERDTTPEMERKFHAMLLDIERLAILANNKASSERLQVYMFGWYATRIVNLISGKERSDKFWELALKYLDDLARRSKDFEALTSQEREQYMKRA